MKVFKRIFTSIVKKPQQTILMFLIVFVLGNVLFASIAIKQTSEDVRTELRSRVPSIIVLEQTAPITNSQKSDKILRFYDELLLNENVKSVECSTSLLINSVDLFRASSTPWFNILKSLDGYNSNEYIEEGRFFTQQELENGENKIVLSYDDYMNFRNQNGESYKVGDYYRIYLYDYEIDIKQTEFGEETRLKSKKVEDVEYIDYEIIGYFVPEGLNVTVNVQSCMPEKTANQLLNVQKQIIDAHPIRDKEIYEKNSNSEIRMNIDKIVIYSKGIDANEALNDEIRLSENFVGSHYKIDSAEADYSYIEAPLENLVALTNVALIGSVIMIVLLLSLISILFIRTRTKEIGVLMSLGEKKKNIILQFAAEIILVGLLATSFSMISGQKIGNHLSQEFMRIQIDTDAEMDYAEDNPDEVTRLDLLDAYHVEMSAEYITKIYIVGFLILTISSILPINSILRVDPKKILL